MNVPMQDPGQHETSYFLTTERLGFRRWRDTDFDLAVALWGDPEVTRPIDARSPLGTHQIRARLTEEVATDHEHGVQYWPVFLLATGEHVGCCGLRPRQPENHLFELGVHIRSAFWRRGYAYEAVTGVIDYAIDHLGVRSLFAGHNPANEASRRLLRKLGFRYTHDEYYAPTGLDHPSYILEAHTR
jgi:ribosomal-protein-alanine N-acetyltransferase